MHVRKTGSLLLTAAAVSSCVPAGPPSLRSAVSPSLTSASIHALDSLYRAHDYFALRTQLSSTDTNSVSVSFYLAAVQQAFNEPVRSNNTIRRALQNRSVPDSLRLELERMQLSNDLRLSQYAQADSVATAILAAPPHYADSATLADIRNTDRLVRALRDVPPQVATIAGSSLLHPDSARHIPVQIGDSLRNDVRHYGFDTGANLSVLMRSEAEVLGLQIRPVGLTVGSSTDASVETDIAVAPRLTIGHIVYQNVVFLVLPDRALTFPDGFRIPGLIGFPVIEAMGEIHFRRDGSLEIPARASTRSLGNLVLEELRPLVQVDYDGERLVCLLDTGAGQTQFFAPYYLRHRTRFDALGTPDSLKTGGLAACGRCLYIGCRTSVWPWATRRLCFRTCPCTPPSCTRRKTS